MTVRRPRSCRRLDLNRPAPLPPSQCLTGKLGWFSERDARDALAAARATRWPGEKTEQAVYRCEFCPSWHLPSRTSEVAS